MANVKLIQDGIGAAVVVYSMIQAQNYAATTIFILKFVVTYAVVNEHTIVFLRFAAKAKWSGDVVGKPNSYMSTSYEEATENTSFPFARILPIVYLLLATKNIFLIRRNINCFRIVANAAEEI